MIQYAMRFLPWLLVILLRYPLAFVAVACAWQNNVTRPFLWLGTIDNDLLGDTGWRSEHLWGDDPSSYINKVRWLWRNGGNHFNYWTIGVPDADAPPWAFWSKTNIPLFAGRFLDLRFGWSPEGPKDGRRKYVFTIRIKTKP